MSLLSTATTLAILVGALLAGFAAVPAAIYLGRDSLPQSLRRVLSRLAFVEGMFAYGGGVLAYLPDGQYRMLRLQEDDNGHYVQCDGARYGVDPDASAWSRLGLHDFAVAAVVSKRALHGLLVDGDRGPGEGSDEAADGGVSIVERGPKRVQAAIPDRGDRLQVSLGKFYDAITAAGGTQLSNRTKDAALEEHGGDDNIDELLFAGAVILCLVLGAATGVLVL